MHVLPQCRRCVYFVYPERNFLHNFKRFYLIFQNLKNTFIKPKFQNPKNPKFPIYLKIYNSIKYHKHQKSLTSLSLSYLSLLYLTEVLILKLVQIIQWILCLFKYIYIFWEILYFPFYLYGFPVLHILNFIYSYFPVLSGVCFFEFI